MNNTINEVEAKDPLLVGLWFMPLWAILVRTIIHLVVIDPLLTCWLWRRTHINSLRFKEDARKFQRKRVATMREIVIQDDWRQSPPSVIVLSHYPKQLPHPIISIVHEYAYEPVDLAAHVWTRPVWQRLDRDLTPNIKLTTCSLMRHHLSSTAEYIFDPPIGLSRFHVTPLLQRMSIFQRYRLHTISTQKTTIFIIIHTFTLVLQLALTTRQEVKSPFFVSFGMHVARFTLQLSNTNILSSLVFFVLHHLVLRPASWWRGCCCCSVRNFCCFFCIYSTTLRKCGRAIHKLLCLRQRLCFAISFAILYLGTLFCLGVVGLYWLSFGVFWFLLVYGIGHILLWCCAQPTNPVTTMLALISVAEECIVHTTVQWCISFLIVFVLAQQMQLIQSFDWPAAYRIQWQMHAYGWHVDAPNIHLVYLFCTLLS